MRRCRLDAAGFCQSSCAASRNERAVHTAGSGAIDRRFRGAEQDGLPDADRIASASGWPLSVVFETASRAISETSLAALWMHRVSRDCTARIQSEEK